MNKKQTMKKKQTNICKSSQPDRVLFNFYFYSFYLFINFLEFRFFLNTILYKCKTIFLYFS